MILWVIQLVNLYDISIINFHILLQKYHENYGFKGFKWNQARFDQKYAWLSLFWVFLEKWKFLSDYLGDSENDLMIIVFLAAVESAVDVDVDVDLWFKNPALVNKIDIDILYFLLWADTSKIESSCATKITTCKFSEYCQNIYLF